MRILWSPLALDRISEIATYIAQDNPTAAENWVETIFAKVEQLKPFPGSGRIVPETDNQKIREIIYCHYRIIYRIEEKQLSILTVRHGKQILPEEEILT
jgi:plasmid stabilization system protein ParE